MTAIHPLERLRTALAHDPRVREVVAEVSGGFLVEAEYDEPTGALRDRLERATGAAVHASEPTAVAWLPEDGEEPAERSAEIARVTGETVDWHERDATFPATLGQALVRAARAGTGGLATVDREGTVVDRTWGELLVRAAVAGASLRAAGIGPGTRAVVAATSPQDVLVAFWSVILADAEPIMIPADCCVDGARLRATVRSLGELLGPLAVVSTPHGPQLTGPTGDLPLGFVDAHAAPPAGRVDEVVEGVARQVSATAGRSVYFMTSGSTGTPKVVPQRHEAILDVAAGSAALNGIDSSTVSLNWMPLSHVGGILMTHVRDVLAGGRHISVDTDRILADPAEWFRLVDRYGVTATWSPNFALRLLARTARSSTLLDSGCSLSTLRFYLNGGEPISHDDVRDFTTALAPYGLPGNCVVPAWGMSETCSGVLYNRGYDPLRAAGLPSVGFPLPNTDVRIVADDAAGLATQQGHLEVRGAGVFGGYAGAPPGDTTDGWFRTGDIASFDPHDGVAICGRDDSRITVNGLTMTTAELESVVEAVEGVVPLTAVVTADGSAGELQVVVFCAVRGASVPAVTEAVRRQVWDMMRVVIGRVVVVPEREIERTSIGKIKRRVLFERYLRAPSEPRPDLAPVADLRWERWSGDAETVPEPPAVRFTPGRSLPLADGPGLHVAFLHDDTGEARGELDAAALLEVLDRWAANLARLDVTSTRIALATVVVRTGFGAGPVPTSHPVAALLRALLHARGVPRVRTLWAGRAVPDALVERALRLRGVHDVRIDADGTTWRRLLTSRPSAPVQAGTEHVVLVGGGGRLGAALVGRLEKLGARVTVVGRSRPSGAVRGSAHRLQADLARYDGRTALEAYLRGNPTPGGVHLVHLAGNPRAGASGATALDALLRPKVDALAGALAVAGATGARLTLVSSVNAHVGGAGLPYYAAACAAAECLVAARPGIPVRVLSVSAVEDAAPAADAALAELSGLVTVPVEQLVEALLSTAPVTGLMGIAPTNRFQNAEGAQRLEVTVGRAGPAPTPGRPAPLPREDHPGPVSAAAIVAAVGARDEFRLHDDATWFDAGLSSVEMPAVAHTLSRELGFAVTIVDLMRHVSPASLASALNARHATDSSEVR